MLQKVVHSTLERINRFRNGEIVDLSVVRACLCMCMNLQSVSNGNLFIVPFLQATAILHTQNKNSMTSANLQLSENLIREFQLAQSTPIRWIQTKITNVTFDFVLKSSKFSTLAEDLEEAKAKALDSEACILLVCVDADKSPKQWIVVAYVPETSAVKKRMLYASGRTDIKNKLGQSYFRGEAHVGEKVSRGI